MVAAHSCLKLLLLVSATSSFSIRSNSEPPPAPPLQDNDNNLTLTDSSVSSYNAQKIKMPTTNITTAGTTTPQQYQQPFLPDFQPESATTTTTAATDVLHVRAEAIARRLQLVLPDIYQDVLNARTNLLSAIKICSGGGEWARQLVQNSAIIRRLTNSATDLTNTAQKNLKRLLHEMDELSDNTIEKILQMIDQAQRSLQQAYDRSKSVADTKEIYKKYCPACAGWRLKRYRPRTSRPITAGPFGATRRLAGPRAPCAPPSDRECAFCLRRVRSPAARAGSGAATQRASAR